MTSPIRNSRGNPGASATHAVHRSDRTEASRLEDSRAAAPPPPPRNDYFRSGFDEQPAINALTRAVMLGGVGGLGGVGSQVVLAQAQVQGVTPTATPSATGRTAEHDRIIEAAGRTQVDPGTDEWSTLDVAQWKTPLLGDPNHIFEFKEQWVAGYSDTIRAAAQMYDLPEELVAGVAYNEVGGDPAWVDEAAYAVRSFDHMADPLLEPLTITREPDLTSFGNVSMQVRRAAETLGYDPNNLTGSQRGDVLESLRDPRQNIFLAAAHLAQLRDIDFPGQGASELSTEEIRATATRFNRGPDLSLDQIRQNTSYGDVIIDRRERLLELLR